LPGNVEIATENYGVTRYHVDDDCLIVVFASAGIDGLGEPIEEFKTSLKGFGMSTMFVIEKKPTWYNHEDTFKVLGDVGAIAQRYSRIAVLGESMGGAGALNFSRFCPGVDRILSLAPQYSVAAPYINFDAGQAPHGRLAQNFWSFAAPEARAKAQILYGNTDWKDAVHAGMYLVEGFSVHFVDGAGHGVAQYLKRSDRLRPLLASFLDFSQAFSCGSVRDAIGTTLYSKLGISAPHRFADYAEQQHRRKQARESPVRPAAPAGYSDLARGCKTDQSSLSKWSRGKTTEEDSAGAVAGRLTGKYAFHTDLEDRPWWRVDFARRVNIVEVRLYNRIDAHRASTRCLRFAIETAAASGDWREVFRKDDDVWFGGADGKPFTWRPEVPLPANQLRIRLLGRDFLHFDAVEVFGA
jgi:hypothetical protein